MGVNSEHPTQKTGIRLSYLDGRPLEQIRAVDRARLVKRLGRLDRRTGAALLAVLGEMFAP